MSAQALIQRGRDALKSFHNASISYSNYPFRNLDELIYGVQPTNPAIFLEGFGSTIIDLEMNDSEVNSAMRALASQAQGRLPANRYSFFKALSDQRQNFSFVDAAKYTAVESAKDLGKGAVAVGQTIITTAKSLQAILPLLLVGAVVYYVVTKTRKISA